MITQVVFAVRAGGRWNGTSSSGIAVYSREASSEIYRDWWISARPWAAVKNWQRQIILFVKFFRLLLRRSFLRSSTDQANEQSFLATAFAGTQMQREVSWPPIPLKIEHVRRIQDSLLIITIIRYPRLEIGPMVSCSVKDPPTELR